MIHFDAINLTPLVDNLKVGSEAHRDAVGAVIRYSDNPAHTALSLLRRVALDDNLDRDALMGQLRDLISLVEYRCIADTEDVIAELRAGDVDNALRILTGDEAALTG